MPPHGRFILEDNSLKFINVQGQNFLERFRNYYNLLPSWKVLKYDRDFLNFWRRSYFSFYGKFRIKNPFYYNNLSEKEESVKINTLLLDKIRKQHPGKTLCLLGYERIYKLYKDIKEVQEQYNLNYLSIFLDNKNFLYERYDHKSSLGNELWASVYFKALTGKE